MKKLDELIQYQQQYEIENEQRKTEYEERLRNLEEERDRLKSENATLLRNLEQDREIYKQENENRKTEQEQLVATEIKTMKEEVRV